MALTDRTTYDSITILEDGRCEVRRARIILDDDGVTELTRTFHRQVLEPGQDVTSFPLRVRQLTNFIWTPAVIAAYLAAKAARGQT